MHFFAFWRRYLFSVARTLSTSHHINSRTSDDFVEEREDERELELEEKVEVEVEDEEVEGLKDDIVGNEMIVDFRFFFYGFSREWYFARK